MIDVRAVTDAVLELLRGTGVDVGDATAPAGNPTSYAVLELPPGGARTGTVSEPEQHAAIRFRIRAVARSQQPEVARREAHRVAHVLGSALLFRATPIAGDGWAVSSRTHDASGGVDVEGELVNVIDDYLLTAVPA